MENATLSRHESIYVVKRIAHEDRDDDDDMLFEPYADEAETLRGYEDFLLAWTAQRECPVTA